MRRNLDGVRKIVHASASVGLNGPFKSFGPMPFFDHCRCDIAVDVVLASRAPGRHSSNYI